MDDSSARSDIPAHGLKANDLKADDLKTWYPEKANGSGWNVMEGITRIAWCDCEETARKISWEHNRRVK